MVLAALFLTFGVAALAQVPDTRQDATIDEIVVTGSRIRRDPINEPTGVLEISRSDLERSGLTNLGDALQNLPITGSAPNSQFNVPGNSGFPQDGASAVYGSDAIGGVVNIITDRDFDGLSFNMQTGGYLKENDGESTAVGPKWGGGNERTRLVLSASWRNELGIDTADRQRSAFPNPDATSCDVTSSFCSSFTPQGRFVFGPNFASGASVTLNDGVLNNGGASIPAFDPANPASGDFHAFTAADRFNYNGANYNYLRTPNERINLFTSARHETGAGLEVFGRRPLESGRRLYYQRVHTWFGTAGLNGEFELGGRNLFWELYGSYGENRGAQKKYNSHNAARLQVAMGDPDVCAATPGCVPFNFFGGQGAEGNGSIIPEMLDFVAYTQRDASRQSLKNVALNFAGDVFSLPAGEAGFAAGIEFREHAGWFRPDPIAERGETAGIPAGSTDGGFRAPGIGEMFGGAAREDFSFQDPCADVLGQFGSANGGRDAPQSQSIIANCAALGVPVDFVQTNPQLSSISAGNRSLDAETSNSYTLGLVWSRDYGSGWIARLTASMDYYRVEISDAVQGRNPADVLNACVNTLDPLFCDLTPRTANGALNVIDNQLQNIGAIEASGWNLLVAYDSPELPIGRFRATFSATLLSKYLERTANVDATQTVTDRRSTHTDETFQRAFPELRWVTNIEWMKNRWSGSLSLRWTDEMTLGGANEVASALFTDARLSITPEMLRERWTVAVGFNNLLDEDPPICFPCGVIGMSQVAHDLPGRVGYLSVSYQK